MTVLNEVRRLYATGNGMPTVEKKNLHDRDKIAHVQNQNRRCETNAGRTSSVKNRFDFLKWRFFRVPQDPSA
jgi:hypothetical protein